MKNARVIFIAGPTASGKSAAAISIAASRDGEIVNADAMQVYRDLHIVTARPSAEDEARIAHHLYGEIDGAVACSAGRWARMAAERIEDILARSKTAVVVGGTGLYFKALEEGLSPIPETPPAFRDSARARRNELGPTAFREEVVSRDPAMARLPEGDAQRLLRAWEVYEATGEPLSAFQDLPRAPLFSGPVEKAVITPAREKLYASCDARAEKMMESGAIEEVQRLIDRKLDPSLPIMKALGVSEIVLFLYGDATREEALTMLQQNTRRFAKRQTTWFRHQTPDWRRFETVESAADSLMQAC